MLETKEQKAMARKVSPKKQRKKSQTEILEIKRTRTKKKKGTRTETKSSVHMQRSQRKESVNWKTTK